MLSPTKAGTPARLPAVRQLVVVSHELTALEVPDLGLTLRTLFAVAAEAYKTTPKRTWALHYRGIPVGNITIKSPDRFVTR
jgi:hypothetical protein